MLKKMLFVGVVLAAVLPFGQAGAQARSYPTMDGGRTYIVPAEPAYVRVTVEGSGTIVVTTHTVNPNGTVTPNVTTFPPVGGGSVGGGGYGGSSGSGGGAGGTGSNGGVVCGNDKAAPACKAVKAK